MRLRIPMAMLLLPIALLFVIPQNINKIQYTPIYSEYTQEEQKEIDCLAQNIYFESKGEPLEGQVAVGFVTLNRVSTPGFPSTICGVVQQRNKHVCQFSWWCESKSYLLVTRNRLTGIPGSVYYNIRQLATHIYANYQEMKDPTEGALFFHAQRINPRWNNLIKTTEIGQHVFYRSEYD